MGKELPEVAVIISNVDERIEHEMELGRCNAVIVPWNPVAVKLGDLD